MWNIRDVHMYDRDAVLRLLTFTAQGHDYLTKHKNLTASLYSHTGRGDTCFSSNVTERLDRDPAEAIRFAAAVTSMKLENRGPFRSSGQAVGEFMKEFYRA